MSKTFANISSLSSIDTYVTIKLMAEKKRVVFEAAQREISHGWKLICGAKTKFTLELYA